MNEWEERDRVLAEALIEFEANAHCPGCGQLRSKAWDEDTAGSWEHDSVKCFACETQDKKKSTTEEPEPGALQFMTLNEDDVRRAKARKTAPKIDLDAL